MEPYTQRKYSPLIKTCCGIINIEVYAQWMAIKKKKKTYKNNKSEHGCMVGVCATSPIS